jgi:NADH:ubiquinone oxidoreductase subunit 5 (subunit L)/multisubunit Na+/H+ antiporter MnhA subunit
MDILNLRKKVDYLLLAAVLTIVILAIGLLIFINQRQSRIKESEREISSVAKDRISYLTNWYIDELNDAKLIESNKILKEKIVGWISNPSISNQNDYYISSGKLNLNTITKIFFW